MSLKCINFLYRYICHDKYVSSIHLPRYISCLLFWHPFFSNCPWAKLPTSNLWLASTTWLRVDLEEIPEEKTGRSCRCDFLIASDEVVQHDLVGKKPDLNYLIARLFGCQDHDSWIPLDISRCMLHFVHGKCLGR